MLPKTSTFVLIIPHQEMFSKLLTKKLFSSKFCFSDFLPRFSNDIDLHLNRANFVELYKQNLGPSYDNPKPRQLKYKNIYFSTLINSTAFCYLSYFSLGILLVNCVYYSKGGFFKAEQFCVKKCQQYAQKPLKKPSSWGC